MHLNATWLDRSLVLCCLLASGCSSNGPVGRPGSSEVRASGADAAADAAGGASNPCHLATTFAGDELCIAPPDPSTGFQLHYGPPSYDDPDVLKPFLLDPGAELTDYFYQKTPNDTEVYLSEYHSRMRPGSHHLIIYATDTDHPDGFGTFDQAGGRMLGGSSTAKRDFPDRVAPENEGLAMKIAARTQVALNLHFINQTDAPILREQWVNFIYKDPATVTTEESPVFHLAGIASAIPANTNKTTKGPTTCTAPADIRIVELHGHYHSHTVRNSAWKVTPDGTRTLIYESYDWHEPASLMFDSVHDNHAPDPVAKVAGGANGILEFKKGDRMEWECEVENHDSWSLPFTNQVDKGEMCIMSGFYAPSTGSTWSCVSP